MTDFRFMLKRRSKKRNFSEKEVAILTEEYKKHVLILNSKLTNSITNQKKQRIWERITDAINTVGVNRRRVSEVKEKWRNMQRKARRIFAERKLRFGHLEGHGAGVLPPPPSSGPSNNLNPRRMREVEKPLVIDIDPLASASSSSTIIEDNHRNNNNGASVCPTTTENDLIPTNSSSIIIDHRSTEDKSSINFDNSFNNNNNNNNNNNDTIINDVELDDHLTIVIKEEIPDPMLKNDDLIITSVQNEPAEPDLTDRTQLELVTPSIDCERSPPSRNTVNSYGFSSHKYNTNLAPTLEEKSAVYNSLQAPRWSTHLQAPSQVSSSKLHPLSGVSMSLNNINVSSSLTSARSYAPTHAPTHVNSDKSNDIVVSSSFGLNNSIPESLASLSTSSTVGRSHLFATGGLSLSHLGQDITAGPGVGMSHNTKPLNRGPTNAAAAASSGDGITQADLLQLQYEVLLADKKRILMQTRYYEMKMKRIELELCGQTNSFF